MIADAIAGDGDVDAFTAADRGVRAPHRPPALGKTPHVVTPWARSVHDHLRSHVDAYGVEHVDDPRAIGSAVANQKLGDQRVIQDHRSRLASADRVGER